MDRFACIKKRFLKFKRLYVSERQLTVRACIQRVQKAKVEVNQQIVGEISKGLVVLLGVHKEDSQKDLLWILDRLLKMRIFSDSEGKMNQSVQEVDGEILLVSQFTLYGQMQKGTRPGFSQAAPGPMALSLYSEFSRQLRERYPKVAEGIFAADMQVSLVNDGPVTLILDSIESL